MNKTRPNPTSVRWENWQQASKLKLLANELQLSQSAVLCKLVENAQIGTVERREPVATLPIIKKQ